jgi:hypothetical protein
MIDIAAIKAACGMALVATAVTTTPAALLTAVLKVVSENGKATDNGANPSRCSLVQRSSRIGDING